MQPEQGGDGVSTANPMQVAKTAVTMLKLSNTTS